MPLRDNPPIRRVGRKPLKHYTSYRNTLREDFDRRCGYCACFDKIKSRSFTIDHFIPQNPDGWTHTLSPTDYYNLVYSCAYCNGAKTNKWPTKDVAIPNDGNIGFIDPVDPAYDQLFNRNEQGEIEISDPTSNLAAYIYRELNLKRTTHSILWKLEKVNKYLEVIEAKAKSLSGKSMEPEVNQLLVAYRILSNEFFNNDDK